MDLSTNYLGMKLRTPLVPSASPLSRNVDDVKRLEDAGAAAVVFHSVFEEQLQPDARTGDFKVGPELYLDHIAQAKASVTTNDPSELAAATPAPMRKASFVVSGQTERRSISPGSTRVSPVVFGK